MSYFFINLLEGKKMNTTMKRRRIGISIYPKPVGRIGSEDGFLILDASVVFGAELFSNPQVVDPAKDLRGLAAFDANRDIHYGYESALRSVDMRYSSISFKTFETNDESMQYRAVQCVLNELTISYRKHSCLRNQIVRYKAKRLLKPCANDSAWRQVA